MVKKIKLSSIFKVEFVGLNYPITRSKPRRAKKPKFGKTQKL